MVITDVTVPTFDPASPDAKKLADQLRDLLVNDLYAQFMQRVETDLAVTYDNAALAQALGAKTDQPQQ
jgi:hypothetical protein